MRKIIYYIATSTDGYIARKNGNVSDFLMEGEHADEFLGYMRNFDTVIMGRATYEFGFQYGLKPGQPAYKGLKHIIISKSLAFESSEEVQLVRQDAMAYIQQLKNQPGKDIWLCGGGKLASQLGRDGLIDALMLKVNPIVIGEGIHVFEGLEHPLMLDLVHSKNYTNGVMLLHYKCKF